MLLNKETDPWANDQTPWLTGSNQTPTDPAAQVEPEPNPWTTPTATPAPAAATPPPGTPYGSYTQDLGPTGFGTEWQAPMSSASTQENPEPYRALVDAMNGAADPQSQSVARDALARRVQADLEADGHKVTWKGDQLIIDGRPYELGGQLTAGPVDARPMNGGAGTGNLQTDFQSATQGLIANERDQTSLNALATRLNGMGYKVSLPETDSQGRNQGLIINGEIWRVIDSGGQWTLVQGSGAWGTEQSGTDLTRSPFATGVGEMPDWLRNPEADPELLRLAETIPGFAEIYERLAATNPDEQATSDLVRKILEHPESLDDRMIETMKARNAEETAAAARTQDEEIQRFGFSAGLDQSPWLAGQRADTAWNARSSIISGNRDVDVRAAETNQTDRRNAAQLGKDWSAYRQGKSERAINTAVETVGVKGDLSRAAKTLGLTKSQLLISYIGQNLNYDINLKSLQQRGEQFAQELAQRIAEMKQRSDEFEASFGIDLNRLQLDKDRFAWDRAQATFGGNGGR